MFFCRGTGSRRSPVPAGFCEAAELAIADGIVISDFSAILRKSALSETDNDRYHRHRPRLPAVPGRGRRIAAPDGAFGLFGNRYLPARIDLERVGRLRQAALRGDRQPRT